MRLLRHLVPQAFGPLSFDGAAGAGDAGAGVTPAGGVTPPDASGTGGGAGATPKPGAAEDPKKPADADGLSDGGKALIAAERKAAKEATDRAKAAEARVAELEGASATDQEKAVAAARREATTEITAKWAGRAREAEVRGALRGAGLTNEKLLALAAQAPEFKDLKVDSDTGTVEGVAAAVDAFRKAYPETFGTSTPPAGGGGAYDGAAGGGAGGKKEPASLEEAVMGRMATQQQR